MSRKCYGEHSPDDFLSDTAARTQFSRRYSHLKPGEYQEIGIPLSIKKEFPDDIAVRMFVTPSDSFPGEGYYLTAIKARKAGWSNGTAVIMCSCINAMFKTALVWCGLKTPCKHAKGLRVLMKAGLPGTYRNRRGCRQHESQACDTCQGAAGLEKDAVPDWKKPDEE